MTERVLMCLAGKRPAQCGITCQGCYRYDTVLIDFCDKCGEELEEEELTSHTNPMLCTKCRKELQKCHLSK